MGNTVDHIFIEGGAGGASITDLIDKARLSLTRKAYS